MNVGLSNKWRVKMPNHTVKAESGDGELEVQCAQPHHHFTLFTSAPKAASLATLLDAAA
jgi:hypothetical protein